MLREETQITKKNLDVKPPEVEQAQKEYIIRNFYDLITALKEHPDWLEEIRKNILTVDLLHIPQKLDELIANFDTVKTEVQEVKTEVKEVKTEVQEVKSEVQEVKSDVQEVKSDVQEVKSELQEVKSDVVKLNTEVQEVKSELQEVKSELQEVKSDVVKLNTEVQEVKSELQEVKSDVEKLNTELQEVKSEVQEVKSEVKEVKSDFERFKTEEFQPLKKKVDKIEQDVEVLKQDMEVLKQDVEILKQEVGILKVDVASLKGDNFERKVREKAPAHFGKLFRKIRVIPIEEWADKLDEAEEENLISEDERNDTLLTDILIKCIRKGDKKELLLAVEASVTADKKDAERAMRRADIFYRLYQIETIPVVITTKVSERLVKSFPTVLFIKAQAE